MVSFMLLALLLPQPRQTRCRSQLPPLCSLVVGDLNDFEKTRFGFALGVGGQGAVF